MRELSIFIDESGDIGEASEYYIVSLVFHDQSEPIYDSIARHDAALVAKGFSPIAMHAGPLLTGHGDYENMGIDARKRLLSSFSFLVDHIPFRYHTFAYRKRHFEDQPAKLAERMKRDITVLLFDNIDYLQTFDQVKIYYDNGQSIVTSVIHDALEYVVSRNALTYRLASPQRYRLFQVADYACTIELTAIKYNAHAETQTDKAFFGTRRTFIKNYLRKLRKHEL